MDMVRHNAPGEQTVAIFIESEQGILHHIRYRKMSQQTASCARVKPLFNGFPAFSFSIGFLQFVKELFKLSQFFLRKGISKPEGNRLNNLPGIKMGQITS